METPKLNAQGFRGMVYLKEWWRWLDGKSYAGFVGTIYIYHDKDVFGFQTRGNESNWFIRIQGKSSGVNVLGCQIRGIVDIENLSNIDSDFLIVP